MIELSIDDYSYLHIKEVMSVLYVGHDEEAETIERYCEFIKSIKFLRTLKIFLEANKEKEFFDEERKNNILKILNYVRFNYGNISLEHTNLINESTSLINTTTKSRNIYNFYRLEYLKRNSDIIPKATRKIPFIFNDIYSSKIKSIIDQSISKESDILNSLLFQEEEQFIVEDSLDFLLNPFFLDTLNSVLQDNPNLFNCGTFKGKAAHILENNIKIMQNISDLYEPIKDREVSKLMLIRTIKTIKRINKKFFS